MIYTEGFKDIAVDGEVTVVEVSSTEEEKKRLIAVIIQKIETEELYLNLTLERETLIEDLVMEIDAYAEPAWRIPVEVDIPIGQTVKILSKSTNSGTSGKLTGYIEYEILG